MSLLTMLSFVSHIPFSLVFCCPARELQTKTIHILGVGRSLADLESQLFAHFKACDESLAMSVIWTMLAEEPKKSAPSYSFQNFLQYLQHHCPNMGRFHDDNTFMESYAFIDGAWVADPVGSGEHFYERALSEIRTIHEAKSVDSCE